MKKLMFFSPLTTLALGIYLHAQQQSTNLSYDGPKDKIYQALPGDLLSYGEAISQTTLSDLARFSDVIGVGQVSQRTNDHFTVTIDHALVGCTNGSVIVVYDGYDDGRETHRPELNVFFPTNMSRIVVAAYTNVYGFGYAPMFGTQAVVTNELWYIEKNLSLNYLNRSWWYADRDDGLLLIQFTNVLQAIRFDRNWTNFFYLCRDGANSLSDRVREDSFWDLRILTGQATPEQFQFILADPLVDQKHKDWRLSKPELNP